MIKKRIRFSSGVTDFYFDSSISALKELAAGRRVIVVTDTNVADAHRKKLSRFETIVVPAGEQFKNQANADVIIEHLVGMHADKSTLLVGVGGGVITDITGYVAAVYMRGISVAFVPTTILAMVDAAIGGKNGVDVGLYKNIVGTIRQPSFLLYDYSLLKTLPHAEWVNGFAEVIKHAAIKDGAMFRSLATTGLEKIKRSRKGLHELIMRNALIKIKVVKQDEFEKGDRRLLNFGHTLGHAIENMLRLPHGHAISIGMVYAAHLSARFARYKGTLALISLLEQYELPTHAAFDITDALDMMMMDKKRIKDELHYILLERNGKAIQKALPVDALRTIFESEN